MLVSRRLNTDNSFHYRDETLSLISSSVCQLIHQLKTPDSLLDLIFGIRAWGLILYGTLPANLALLGTLEVKLGKVDDLKYFLIPVASFRFLLPFF